MPFYSIGEKLSKSTIPINDIVLLEVLESDPDSRKVGNIILPDSVITNTELIKCKIINVGPLAEKEYLKKDDIVLVDRWSCFGGGSERVNDLVITKVENVILVYKEN